MINSLNYKEVVSRDITRINTREFGRARAGYVVMPPLETLGASMIGINEVWIKGKVSIKWTRNNDSDIKASNYSKFGKWPRLAVH